MSFEFAAVAIRQVEPSRRFTRVYAPAAAVEPLTSVVARTPDCIDRMGFAADDKPVAQADIFRF